MTQKQTRNAIFVTRFSLPRNSPPLVFSSVFIIHRHNNRFKTVTMFLSRSSLVALAVVAIGSANASCPNGNDPQCAWGKKI